jgi:hypothetical protein
MVTRPYPSPALENSLAHSTKRLRDPVREAAPDEVELILAMYPLLAPTLSMVDEHMLSLTDSDHSNTTRVR